MSTNFPPKALLTRPKVPDSAKRTTGWRRVAQIKGRLSECHGLVTVP